MEILIYLAIFMYVGIGLAICLIRYNGDTNSNPKQLIILIPLHMLLWLHYVIALAIYQKVINKE